MKTTQGAIVKAWKALNSLEVSELRLSYKVFWLMRQLRPFIEFQEQEERRFLTTVEKTKGEDGCEKITPEGILAFNARVEEIAAMEQEVNIEPEVFRISDNMKLTPAQLFDLEGFIEIQGGGNDGD